MKGFKSTSANPYTYIQSGVWKAGQYTFQAVVKSDSGYAIAFQKPDLSWDVIDLSWQVQAGQYCSVLEAGFSLEYDAVAFKLIANAVTGEVIVLSPMLEKGGNPSTPIAHEEDLRGMDGDNHEFIFTRNDTWIAPDTPLSTQDDDYVPEDWTDNAQGVTKELPFEFVSMREKKNGVWLDFSPPSLWAKWAEDGFNVKLHLQGHYVSRWEGTTRVTEIVGGEIVNGSEVVKITAKIRKGEKDVTADELLSRGFIWYANGVEVARDVPSITLDETYGDGFADYVVLSYLVNSLREEEQVEVLNISAGMDGIGEEFIFKANNSETEPPILPKITDTNYQDDDYYGQGTANEWSDDPVSPTEANQFVWTAKRKKVGGIWEAFGTPSIWTRLVTDGIDVAYWELHSSAPLIYKDAEDASTSGVHTTITLSGRYVAGVSSLNGGYISAQPIGGVEDTPLMSPREFTPPSNAGVDGYVIRLYDDVSKTTLLDTLTVPIAFKGEKGVSAINITLSNESDALPASPEGVVSDYSGSGTTIRVFEGATELSYGTGNGMYQVVATGSNISPNSTPTTNGNARVYGNASNMGANAIAVITFTVSGKTFDGESFSFDKVQNFTKSERGDEGENGEDGITIIPNQQGYTYRADLNGGIIGSLANGMVELTIMNGSTPITCPSATSGGTPTTDGTYRVTRTLGNGITTNSSVSDGKYRITPATLIVDEASVNLEIKIMIGGVITSYPLILTYRKQFDGADGKSTEFIFKGHISDVTYPALPSTSQQDDWYGQGTANEWNDDLVEPTKTLPYVWASQRTKVGGVWGAFMTPKVWLRYSDGITSTIIEYVKSSNGTTPPSSGWSTSIPTPTQGWYLWTRTTTTYKVAETTVSYSVSHWAEDGDGIVSTTIEYAKSSSGITIPTSWSTSLPTPTKGWYLWTRTTTVYKLSQTTVAYSISYWSEDGVSISGVDVEFAKNTNVTTPPAQGDAGWTTTVPTLTGTEQLWTRTKTTYSSGNPTYSTPANITPKTGAVGQGIESVTEQYHISASKTTRPAEGSSGWSETQPTWIQGQYIWSRVKVVYKNPASTIYTGYAVSSEWEAVNELEIGGRNLLLNTGNFTDTVNWAPYDSIIATVENGMLKLVGELYGYPRYYNYTLIPLTGYVQEFRITVEYISTGGISIGGKSSDSLTTFNELGAQNIGTVTNLGTEIVDGNRKKTIFKWLSLVKGTALSSWLQIELSQNQICYIVNIKLERGNKATDWTPAPEDVQAKIDAVGKKYIPMGWWSPSVTYRKTELGVPLVKRADGTGGYSVYTLRVVASTQGYFFPVEWDIVESAEFIYMQQAYIERLQAEVVTADRINAIDITSRRVLATDANNNKIASMNEFGDGAYIQYYPSGRKRMVFGGGLIVYYADTAPNSELWSLGQSGSIQTMTLDRWVEGYYVATDSDGTGVKKLELSGGIMYKRFKAGSASTYTSYDGLTVKGTVYDSTTPDTVPSGSYIPSGWYTNPSIAMTNMSDPPYTYRRTLIYFSSGKQTSSKEIVFTDYGDGLPTE